MQTSESFRLSAILSFSGGLQDAYTYNVRGSVFANAQTGNVVLMSQNYMVGNWSGGVHYMFPLLSFAAGVFITERIENRFKYGRIHWRQIILLIEILLLGIVGFMPEKFNTIANMLVSFACAMQVQTFRKVHGYGYASTMCIGNLRSGTESLSVYLREREPGALRKAAHYYGIILLFGLGAAVGGGASVVMGMGTIWLCCLLLLADCLMMIKERM
jgi:uncharacterized membrane protein YoaK (UPF0700 family)